MREWKKQEWKIQEWKMREQIAGLENAGVENTRAITSGNPPEEYRKIPVVKLKYINRSQTGREQCS